MVKITIPIDGVSKEYLPQLEYALTFASEAITACQINEKDHVVEAHVRAEENREQASQKIRELIQRYAQSEFGSPQVVQFMESGT